MNDTLPESPPPVSAARGRSRMVTIVVVLAVLAVAGVAWWLAHRGATPQQGFGGGRGNATTTVGVAKAETGDMPVRLEAIGTVVPTATVTVRPQVSGVISKVLFTEGQLVKAGDVLAVIDPRPYEAAKQQAEGNLQRDEAQLQSAKLTLARYQTLLGQDSIAGQDVDTQAATVKQLEGTVIADRAALATAQLNLGYTNIVSPVRGRTGLRVVDAGNYISAGDAAGVVVVTVVDPIDVEFTLPQDQVPQVLQRLAASGADKLPVTVLDRTRSTTLAQGHFLTLDNVINTSTGTVRAKARFDNGKATLFPNQFVNVSLLVDTLTGVVQVPASALRSGADGSFVYVLDRATSKVAMRKVRSGTGNEQKVSILDGLKEGEEVITEGGDGLTDGATVQLPGAAPVQGGQKRNKRPQRP